MRRVVHISAIGVDRETPNAFSCIKLAGAPALMARRLDWVILRPSVLPDRAAYGGSALIRGLAGLPVVWMQMRMRDLAAAAAERGEPLPPAYYRLYRTWFAFGFPAFAAVLAIFWLMIARPAIAL